MIARVLSQSRGTVRVTLFSRVRVRSIPGSFQTLMYSLQPQDSRSTPADDGTHHHAGCLCLFATHFHELTALEEAEGKGVQNLHVMAEADPRVNKLTMLYKVSRLVPSCSMDPSVHAPEYFAMLDLHAASDSWFRECSAAVTPLARRSFPPSPFPLPVPYDLFHHPPHRAKRATMQPPLW